MHGRFAVLGALVIGLSAAAASAGPPSAQEPRVDAPDPTLLAFVAALDEHVETAAAPFVEQAFPFLDDEDASASISIGDTSHGSIVNAKRIREDDALGILPRQRERDLGYGGDELVALLEETARAFRAKTSTKLWIGNIGRRGGGDIPWSVSHNAGRDADVAFAYTDADGKPVDPPDLVPVDARGESKAKDLRFDVARTWTIVRALVESKRAQLQYLFISEPLKGKLLKHAREKGEPGWIVTRAGDLMHQPGGAPHDDHLHVRVFCSARDVGGGCVDTGVVHEWSKLASGARAERIARASSRLEAPDASLRARAIRRLERLDARAEIDRIAGHLEDPAADVRAAAALATGTLGEERHVDALVARFDRERDVHVRAAILGAMRTAGGPRAGGLLARALASLPAACEVSRADDGLLDALTSFDDDRGFSPAPLLMSVACVDAAERGIVARAAVDAAGYADRVEPVDALLGIVASRDGDLALRAADALERITNRPLVEAVRASGDASDALVAFRRSIAQLARAPRDAWIATGFLAAGYDVPRFEKKFAWELVRALGKRDHLAYNARAVLERVTDHKAPWLAFDAERTCSEWLAYVVAHRRSLGLDPAPEATIKSCERKRAP